LTAEQRKRQATIQIWEKEILPNWDNVK